MYLTTDEIILTTLFNCGVADLCMLDDCFTELSEDACNPTGILEELRDNGELSLNRFLFDVYYSITDAVYNKAYELFNNAEYTTDITGYNVLKIDNEETFREIELPVNFASEGERKEFFDKVLVKLVESINTNNPFTNCLDTYYQNALDQVVDYELNVLENAILVLKYEIDNIED